MHEFYLVGTDNTPRKMHRRKIRFYLIFVNCESNLYSVIVSEDLNSHGEEVRYALESCQYMVICVITNPFSNSSNPLSTRRKERLCSPFSLLLHENLKVQFRKTLRHLSFIHLGILTKRRRFSPSRLFLNLLISYRKKMPRHVPLTNTWYCQPRLRLRVDTVVLGPITERWFLFLNTE